MPSLTSSESGDFDGVFLGHIDLPGIVVHKFEFEMNVSARVYCCKKMSLLLI